MAAAALLGLVGALLGAFSGGLGTAILGFAVGFSVSRLAALTNRLESAEGRLRDLEAKAAARERAEPLPSVAPPPRAVAAVPPPAERFPTPDVRPASPPPAPPPVKPTEPQPTTRAEAPRAPRPVDERASVTGSWGGGPRWVIEFFTTGNVLAKVGVVILFFGAAFLVRYAADRGLLPIEFRLMGLVVGALVLQGVGWRLRHSRAGYATALQGGAVGLLYLTIFAAFRLYELLPAFPTFVLLLTVVAFSAALAVLQNEPVLAVLGTSGGFLAPILASTGSGSHVGLFSYYLILNAGVLGIAWFRSWRVLNWIGFVFTFGIGFFWGWQYYQPAMFWSTEPFLVAFFLFYVAVAVLFAHRQPPQLRGYVDGSLVFGTPALAFAMQSSLVSEIPFGRAFSAVTLSALYLALAGALRRRLDLRMLTEAFIALGVVFLTLAVPLAFEGHGTAAAWALEGAGLVWIGVRQQRLVARLAGTLLLFGAGFSFQILGTFSESQWPVVNSQFLGSAAITAGGFLAAHQYFKAGSALRKWEGPVEWILLGWALLWWAGATGREILEFVPRDTQIPSLLLVLSATGALAAIVARRIDWPSLKHATIASLPLTSFWALGALVMQPDAGPLPNLGWIAWPAAIVVNYLHLRLFEEVWPKPIASGWHAGTAWLFWFLLTWAGAALAGDLLPEASTWTLVAWAVVPSVLLMALLQYGDRLAWPVRRHETHYATVVPTAPAAFLMLWVIWACTRDGNAAPLPYVPLLNPLEIAQGTALAAVAAWWMRARKMDEVTSAADTPVVITLASVMFLALNAVVARIVHVWFEVPWSLEPMAESAPFQAGISVLWALTALSLMTTASRRASRSLWLVGAGLLAALVVKLFVADLSQVGAIARIVSFLVTGVLILVIGYVAPVPPKEQKVSS